MMRSNCRARIIVRVWVELFIHFCKTARDIMSYVKSLMKYCNYEEEKLGDLSRNNITKIEEGKNERLFFFQLFSFFYIDNNYLINTLEVHLKRQ